jgi:hypothetical protein
LGASEAMCASAKGCGLPAANQIPVCPRSRVEDARRSLLQHLAIFVFANDPAQRLQIFDRTEHHEVGEELHKYPAGRLVATLWPLR